MATNWLIDCACAFTAITYPDIIGTQPQRIVGQLLNEASTTLKVGDWVQYNTTSNGWEKIETGDTISTASQIGVIAELEHYRTGQIYGTVDVSSVAFLNAQIWTNGGGQIPCGHTYLYNGTTRTAFDPETHTSLAARLRIHNSTGLDGTVETKLFSFY